MSQTTDAAETATETLLHTLEPRPLIGETVTVDVDRDDLLVALAALDALAAADRPTETGRATVAAVRSTVRTRLDRLDSLPDETVRVRFDAADTVLLALAHVSLARTHRGDGAGREARFLQGARAWLGHLGAQRPALVDALNNVD